MAYNDHTLYEKGDAGVPNQIKDRNGDIVLGLCKICGKGEVELEGSCITIDEKALNEASWMFVECAPKGSITPDLWNHIKQALRPAVQVYLKRTTKQL